MYRKLHIISSSSLSYVSIKIVPCASTDMIEDSKEFNVYQPTWDSF